MTETPIPTSVSPLPDHASVLGATGALYDRLPSFIEALLPVALTAGAAILRHYAAGVAVVRKQDGSPTTAADAEAEAIITEALHRLTPDIPVVAEEAMEAGPAPEVMPGGAFWLVDPLDGTKEFVGRTGEFTVNIALVVAHQPVLGIVYVPVTDDLYWGTAPGGAFCRTGGAGVVAKAVTEVLRLPAQCSAPYRVVMSRSHGDRRSLTERFGHVLLGDAMVAGSSLKFCRVAEGVADFYPRLGPTMEWDTAAGQAVVTAAGGEVLTLEGAPFHYQKPDWRNPGFVVLHPAMQGVVFA
jgi:3'(2'), 5'-bisphosphate nucleotidase